MATVAKSAAMQAQYQAWPYPALPLLASLPSTHPFELHVSWLWDRAGSGRAPERPRIWNAGCGTFQPYAFAVANPKAEILATDISEASLAIARRRCLVHGRRNVRFAPVDLDDPSTWPDGEFDLIECYGVLMNVADPLATLRGLAAKLSPRGVLRLMVYPQYSRSRVFQVQRLAQLLGLHPGDRSHPAALRTFVRRLDRAHPLRFAFTTYADSKNDAGVVDGFLHAGDRGFTGFQLGGLLQAAGLEPGHWFHRPWAQPDGMAERLRLPGRSQSFVLDYLDLWQELRGNFVVVARRSDAGPRLEQDLVPHPQFAGGGLGLRHTLRLARLQLVGGRLPTRTADGDVVLKPADARALVRGTPTARLQQHGLVLGGDHGSRLPAHADFADEDASLTHMRCLQRGRRAPNPLYAHLFAAFERAARHPGLGLPDLEDQMGRWLPWADPLEHRPFTFGLSPYGTYLRFRTNVQEHLARTDLVPAAGYADVRLRGDGEALARVRRLLAQAGELPAKIRSDAELRELFVLLCAHDSLFLTLE